MQQEEEGRVAGCYYKPTRLPNERLEFESHHWIFLRTAGDVSICFVLAIKPWCYSRCSGNVITGSGTISIREPDKQNKCFKPNHDDCFLTLTEWFLCLSLTHSVATREKQKIRFPQTERLRRIDVKKLLTCLWISRNSPWQAFMMKGDSSQFTNSTSDIETNSQMHTNTIKTSDSLLTFVLLVWPFCFCMPSKRL